MKLSDYKKDSFTIHIIGIGGIGMSAIAHILLARGYRIQGSDLRSNYNTDKLELLGVRIFYGHYAENLIDVNYVIISSDIKSENIEIKEALRKEIKIASRAEVLAELMTDRINISVAGTHGKTTTTSLTAFMLESLGLSPTVVNGGIIVGKEINAYEGTSNYMVVEADESDGTFLKIPTTIGIVTNIDPEHLSFYGDFNNLKKAFEDFILNIPSYGFAVVCLDDKEIEYIVSNKLSRQDFLVEKLDSFLDNKLSKKIITYGINNSSADIRAINIRQEINHSLFDIVINQERVINDILLPVSGIHNVLNSLAPIAIAINIGASDDDVRKLFEKFSGVKRRFTRTGEFRQALVVDDYAHHPREIMATLANAKNYASKKEGRVFAILQPHRYSRLRDLFDDFAKSFNDADVVFLTDVYSAGEREIPLINSDELINKIKSIYNHIPVYLISSVEDLADKIQKYDVKNNDILVFMGAGDITNWAYKMAKITADDLVLSKDL